MSLLATERALCNRMGSGFDSIVTPIIAGKQQILQAQRSIKSGLNTMLAQASFSLPSVIAVEATSLKNSAKDLYPGDTLAEMEAMKDLINGCDYLQSFAPVANILGTALGVFDKMNDLINSITFPEFGIANLGSLINGLVGGIGLPGTVPLPGAKGIGDLLKKADTLIECLGSICGAGSSEYIALASDYAIRTTALFAELNIVDNPLSANYGKFNFQSIYDDLAMSADEQLGISTALDAADSIKTSAVDAIGSSAAKVKELTKLGFF